MANSRQSLKRARQAVKRNEHNVRLRSETRTFLKKTYNAVKAKDATAAKAAFAIFVPAIDKLVGKGLVHKNKAARHKQRLNAHIKKLAAA